MTAQQILSKVMQEDPDCAWSWHCCITMMAIDAGKSSEEARIISAEFMLGVFGVTITENKRWEDYMRKVMQPGVGC